jgi:hypothetical protein
MDDSFDALVDMVDRDMLKRILVVDRTREDSVDDNVDILKGKLNRAGFYVAVQHQGCKASELATLMRSTSILSIIKNKREVTIVVVENLEKKQVLPQNIETFGGKRVVILYMHTRMQKNPYTKGKFEEVFLVNDVDAGTNDFVIMAETMKDETEPEAWPARVEKLGQHDAVMLYLILMHNVFACAPPFAACAHAYAMLRDGELASRLDDGGVQACMTQLLVLLSLLKGSPQKRPFLFTQHLSRHSVHSATRKRMMDRIEDMRQPGQTWETMILANHGAAAGKKSTDVPRNVAFDVFQTFRGNVTKTLRSIPECRGITSRASRASCTPARRDTACPSS